jgi:SNF2 family DNA or RNA helicase
MKGFPPKVFVVRDVFLEGKQLELYKKICGEVVSGISKDSFSGVENFLNNNNRLIRLRQAMNHPMLLGEEGDSAKYKELDNILEELLSDPEQKVVIWTEFRAAVDLLFQRYDSEYGAVKIYGGVDNDELAKIAEKFENGDRPRVAIAIPAKAGTGVDFLARARTAIYVDRPYSLVLYKQSLDRIHRRVDTVNPKPIDIIRSKPATIMFLDIVNSVDELVREKLANKWDVAEAVTTSNESLVEMGRGDLLKYLL